MSYQVEYKRKYRFETAAEAYAFRNEIFIKKQLLTSVTESNEKPTHTYNFKSDDEKKYFQNIAKIHNQV